MAVSYSFSYFLLTIDVFADKLPAHGADTKDEESPLEADAKGELGSDPQKEGAASGPDPASAKSDQDGNIATADAHDDAPRTNDDGTNKTGDEKAEVKTNPNEAGDGEDDGEHVPEGDEDAAIY